MAKPAAPKGQTELVTHVVQVVDHWNQLAGLTQHERLYGLAVSLLGALDGKVPTLPGYAIIPLTKGDPVDVAGELHRQFVLLAERMGKTPVASAPLSPQAQADIARINNAFDSIPLANRNVGGAKPV